MKRRDLQLKTYYTHAELMEVLAGSQRALVVALTIAVGALDEVTQAQRTGVPVDAARAEELYERARRVLDDTFGAGSAEAVAKWGADVAATLHQGGDGSPTR